MMNAIALAQDLIRCPSVTPVEGGALRLLEKALKSLGFQTHFLVFDDVSNLYATIGSGKPHFCFAGHTDVVPPGDAKAWTIDPFSGLVKDGYLWGRGATDMKGAIGAFLATVSDFLRHPFEGTLSLLITGDEEGKAFNGTQKVLQWLQQQNISIDLCLVGEPTSAVTVGESLKIGRRGSVTARLTCYGTQGHIAYPENFDNPIPRLLKTLSMLQSRVLDEGTDYFEPSRLEITTIDTGNPASNIIPNKVSANFGIRINPLQDPYNLVEWLHEVSVLHGGKHTLDATIHGAAYYTQNKTAIDQVCKAVEKVTGILPSLSTTGGTTDGRFLAAHMPVVECGLTEETMHQVDERIALGDIYKLQKIYLQILEDFFRSPSENTLSSIET